MIKQIAWNTFKNTGNINTYLELTEMKKLEDDIILGEKYGNNQNQRNNNSRK
ncbi:MAG: YqzL family protein [Clostridia bacterium]|nr:YqzL family protein [Clostridia bacterium]